ncbi:MAG: transporter substrate-binding domain-containing protein [Alphaproteobacteria bacterium]|nr:transporter substrate-binding domain-containing protein [Alphaproteobacteria bacterium]
MRDKLSWLAFVLAAVALALVVSGRAPTSDGEKKETAFEHIMRTGTIRCGYLLSPATLMKDPNTGTMSGVMADYLQALGDALHLKVVWQEEMNLATYLQDLQNGRYDLECSGGWPNALRGKQVEYSTPIYYFPFYGAVRSDDRRFDNNYAAMNNASVRIAGHDGGTNSLIRERRFPNSTYVGLANGVPLTNALLEIMGNKADVTFLDYPTFQAFMNSNPGKLRKVDGPPVRLIPTNISFAAGEYRLQQMLNTATSELLYDGVIDRILDKYEPAPGTFLRVAVPYASSGLEGAR